MRRRAASDDSREGQPTRAVWPEKVVGGKYVKFLSKLLKSFREADAHGNRRLFLDDVFVAQLLAFYNPTIRSLRCIEDFSQTVQAQRHLSTTRLCRSTHSDFHRLVDPQRLQPMITVLRAHLARKRAGRRDQEDDLSRLLRTAVAVDGTFLPACAEIAWAVRSANQRTQSGYKARIDFDLNVSDGLPDVVVVPEPGQSEADSAIPRVVAGQVRLYDRGFNSFDLINAHYEEAAGQAVPRAHFVIRFRQTGSNSPTLVEATEQSLSAADEAAGVISDRVGSFRSSKMSRHRILDVQLREVVVQRQEGDKTDTIRLITNLHDVPAAVIAQLYRMRWQVELFFRWLKCFGNFNHLLSHSASGALMQFYVAVIATMLMYLHTGYRPSKYLFTMLSLVSSGGATAEEILPILKERERQSDLARRSAAARRVRKKAEQ